MGGVGNVVLLLFPEGYAVILRESSGLRFNTNRELTLRTPALPSVTASGPLLALPPGGERPCGLPRLSAPIPQAALPRGPPRVPELGPRLPDSCSSLGLHLGPESAAPALFSGMTLCSMWLSPCSQVLGWASQSCPPRTPFLSQHLACCVCANCLISCLDRKPHEGRVHVHRTPYGPSTFLGA